MPSLQPVEKRRVAPNTPEGEGYSQAERAHPAPARTAPAPSLPPARFLRPGLARSHLTLSLIHIFAEFRPKPGLFPQPVQSCRKVLRIIKALAPEERFSHGFHFHHSLLCIVPRPAVACRPALASPASPHKFSVFSKFASKLLKTSTLR